MLSKFVISKIQLDANYNDFSSASNVSYLKDEIIREVAKWGGLVAFIGDYSRIPKENISFSAGSVLN